MSATRPEFRRKPACAWRTWLLASLLLPALAACQRPASPGNPPAPEVGFVTVAPRAVRLTDEFNGRVEAIDAVELRPRVSGYLQRLAYREGDTVAAGAVLFVIDQRPYRIALDRAEAQRQRAQAALQLAGVQLARVRALMSSHATSQEELDNAQATAAQAEADLHAAQAAVDEAKLDLGYTEVRSPIAGRAGRAALTVGNLARADQTLLTSIVSQDPVYVYFDCDEQSYLRYTAQGGDAGQPAIGASRAVHVGLADESGFPHAGSIDFQDNRVDPATGTIRARVRLANPERRLTPGLYARVQLGSGRDDTLLLVDDKAVLADQDRRYVYVVSADDRAQRRDVKIGREIGGERVIEAGLRGGERVVVDGVQRIAFPGAPIKPAPLAASPAAASAAASRS